MSGIKYSEALVFAFVEKRITLINGRALDSSYDKYDAEYGWTAADYRRAIGGTEIGYYNICICIYSLNTKKVLKTIQRFKCANIWSDGNRIFDDKLQKALEGYVFINGRADTVVFHRFGNILLDIGKYGITDTLTGKKLSSLVGTKHSILEHDGPSIFFTDEYPSDSYGIYAINLEEGLKIGQFKITQVFDKEKKDFSRELWKHHLEPFVIEVNGEKFTVDNKRYKDYAMIDSSRILAPDGQVIWQGDSSRYVADAIGFPENLLLNEGGMRENIEF
jgi:hypothetical protein